MRINLNGTALAAGVLLSSMAGPVDAFVYASSRLLIDNLVVSATPASNLTPIGFTSTVADIATLNSLSSSSIASCGGLVGMPGSVNTCSVGFPRLDAGPVSAPGSVVLGIRPPGGNYSFLGPLGQQFANAAVAVDRSQATGDGVTSIRAVAETNLAQGPGTTATATAQVASNVFNFTISAAGTMAVRFDADPDLFAQIADPSPGPFSATASLSLQFTLDDLSSGSPVNVFTWRPRGTMANDCVVNALYSSVVTCNETDDSEDLNTLVTTNLNNAPPVMMSHGPLFMPYGIAWSLPAGVYSLTLTDPESTRVSRSAIPEPETIGLFAVAWFAAMVVRRRGHAGI